MMSKLIYKVWSAYPPALSPVGQEYVRIVAGTIYKIQVGSTPIPINQPLPATTELSQIQWMKPAPTAQSTAKPITATVAGSNGKTYLITTYPGGRKTCTCPGFSFRKTCKHTQ